MWDPGQVCEAANLLFLAPGEKKTNQVEGLWINRREAGTDLFPPLHSPLSRVGTPQPCPTCEDADPGCCCGGPGARAAERLPWVWAKLRALGPIKRKRATIIN